MLTLLSSLEIDYSTTNLKNNFSYINLTDSNLTIHLSFDVQENSSLNITGDSSGYLHNGTLGNSTLGTQPFWNSSGYLGGAYTLDGLNDYIDIDNNFISDYPFSFSGFFNAKEGGMILAVGSTSSSSIYYNAGLLSTGEFQVTVRNNSDQHIAPSSDTYLDNSWHAFSVNFKNDSYRQAYVDGVSVINDTYNSSFLSSNKFYVGARVRSTKDSFFNGSLDEIMVFNRTLNYTEIKNLMFTDYIDNPLVLNVSIHTRNSYKKNFDTIDFNFSVEHQVIDDPDDPLDHANLTFTSQYSYDGVNWYNITDAYYVPEFNVSEWSGCFGDSLTSYSGRWPPTLDSYANTNLSTASGSTLQKGYPGATCDEIFASNITGNLINNTYMFLGCGVNDINSNYLAGLSVSENIAEIMADYREIVDYAAERNVSIHFINLVAADYTNLTGDIEEITEDEYERINARLGVNNQSYDYYTNNEHNGVIISYSDVWTPLVDPSNNASVLPIYGTLNSNHPSTAGNLVYADAVWSDNYHHKKNGEYYVSFYPSYPSKVKFRFNVTSLSGGNDFYETGYYTLRFVDDESACSSAGRYWYLGRCNLLPQSNTSTTSSGGGSSASPSSSNLESGYTTNLRKNFDLEIGNNILTLTELQGNTATIEIAGESYSIDENGEIKIDTDSDGYYDVQVNAGNVNDVYATLTVKTIYEEVPASELEGTSSEVGSPNDKFKNSKAFWVMIGVAGLILIGFAGYSIYKKKN